MVGLSLVLTPLLLSGTKTVPTLLPHSPTHVLLFRKRTICFTTNLRDSIVLKCMFPRSHHGSSLQLSNEEG